MTGRRNLEHSSSKHSRVQICSSRDIQVLSAMEFLCSSSSPSILIGCNSRLSWLTSVTGSNVKLVIRLNRIEIKHPCRMRHEWKSTFVQLPEICVRFRLHVTRSFTLTMCLWFQMTVSFRPRKDFSWSEVSRFSVHVSDSRFKVQCHKNSIALNTRHSVRKMLNLCLHPCIPHRTWQVVIASDVVSSVLHDVFEDKIWEERHQLWRCESTFKTSQELNSDDNSNRDETLVRCVCPVINL